MTRISATWDDAESWLIAASAGFTDATVRNIKPAGPGPFIVLRVDPGARVTPVSRTLRLGISAWVVSDAGESMLPEARQLALEYGAWLEELLNTPATSGPFLDGEVDSGPVRVADPDTGLTFAYLTFWCTQHVKRAK